MAKRKPSASKLIKGLWRGMLRVTVTFVKRG